MPRLGEFTVKKHSRLTAQGDLHTPKIHGASVHDATSLDTTTKLLAQNVRQTYNRLAGIVPTFDSFDTNPSSPENMTDGDFTTESGEGVKELAAADVIGNIKFDMGAVYPVLITAWMNVHRASGDGTISIMVESSPDGVSYYSAGVNSRVGLVGDLYRPLIPIFMYARYFRIRISSIDTSVASVYHVKVAEVMAIQLI